MGSLAIATMSPSEGDIVPKKLHPFFTGGLLPTSPNEFPRPSETDEVPSMENVGTIGADEVGQSGQTRKRRKINPENTHGQKRVHRGRPQKVKVAADNLILEHRHGVGSVDTSDAEPTSTVAIALLGGELPSSNPSKSPAVDAASEPNDTPKTEAEATKPSQDPTGTNGAQQYGGTSEIAYADGKFKKLLKFNAKTGKLGSPANTTEFTESAKSDHSPSAKERKRKARVVTIRYGHDSPSRKRTGKKIQAILDQSTQPDAAPFPLRQDAQNDRSDTAPRPPAKTTHPFFAGKHKKADDNLEAKPEPPTDTTSTRKTKTTNRIFLSTPCSPKKSRLLAVGANLPQFGIKSQGLKIPGSCLPMWPPKDMSHIRGEPVTAEPRSSVDTSFTQRKSKGNAVHLTSNESVLSSIIKAARVQAVRESLYREDATDVSPQGLRLPSKHFESGPKLQRRVAGRLKTYQPSLDEDMDELGQRSHPSIVRLFDSLKYNLSAYDRSDCEVFSWAQKYAPLSAAEVLQGGKEGQLLKDWLLKLKIDAVDTGPDGQDKPSKVTAPKKKRKRKELDDFIISSDEEENELGEVSDDEGDWLLSSRKDERKTVMQKAKEGRLTNAVVISGPNGCGKSAAVYAIAKELDFEVFEINASSRRSGKDVLEKVGDMTRNHLVQQHRVYQNENEPEVVEEDEVARDLKSGRQGTMMSFFRPKGQTSRPNGGKTILNAKPTTTSSIAPKSAPPKAQKQSLILLEEVDILYEEDKQFWATLFGLIAQSKRPFVMTCNDENLVPIQSLNLHGIFRFKAPPAELAVDLLLLIAANEGHVLQRRAVEHLYEGRGHDLRASLMELNFWCQIGVGDRRGGMDWFIHRWPKGRDLDEHGNCIRVLSECTYQAGMGWFGRDPIADGTPVEGEEEMLTQAWDLWGQSLEDLVDGTSEKAMALWDNMTTASARVAALDAYCRFSDATAASDVLSAGAFCTGYKVGQECSYHSTSGLTIAKELLDPTLPDLTSKSRDDFTLGRALLDAPLLASYSQLPTVIPTAMKCLARYVRRQCITSCDTSGAVSALEPLTESAAIACIKRALKKSQHGPKVTRMDMAFAFDPIAVSEKLAGPMSYLDPSIFDGTMRTITLDAAPFVRTIVAYDEKLRKERLRLSNLMSENGRSGKRIRTTRNAFAAMAGGSRSTTRRENWFAADVNAHLVLETGGQNWQKALKEEMALLSVDLTATLAVDEADCATDGGHPGAAPLGDVSN